MFVVLLDFLASICGKPTPNGSAYAALHEIGTFCHLRGKYSHTTGTFTVDNFVKPFAKSKNDNNW
jgi:hypothetical protein